MINNISVPDSIADPVNKLLHSIRPNWQYMPLTNDYYNLTSDPVVKQNIDMINQKYGPVIDTQRFTDEFYNDKQQKYKASGINGFIDIRSNPKSRYNNHFPDLAKLVDYLQNEYISSDYKVARLMVNMQTIRPTWSMNAPHPDYTDKRYITILYYVNNSDGDTYFFDGSECIHRASPIKGTAAMYPSHVMHAGSTPTKTDTRVVINLCFGPK